MAHYNVQQGSRHIRKRNFLLGVSLSFIFLYIFSGMVSRYEVYVLEAGFPLTRLAPSSGEYRPVLGQGSSPALRLHSVTAWPKTQHWTPLHTSGAKVHDWRYPQCQKLLGGDEVERKVARRFMAENVPVARSDGDYIRDTLDCSRFVRERGYILDASKKEKEFPIAFSLLFYKDVEQAERLLRSIYRPHNYYCLHLDKKASPSTLRAARGLASCLQNVFLASKQVDVRWGTITVLEPELVCMRDLWAYKRWRYFINLTGQEFPLKTNLQLVDILTAFNGSNDVDCTTNPWYNNFRAPDDIQPVKGNVHVTASRAFVDYILHSHVAGNFLKWVNFTAVPDETFFSTLNHNPHLKVPGSYLGACDTDAVLKPYLSRYKNWGTNWRDKEERTNFNWPCYGKRVRTICIAGVGDLPSLTSRKELFANKFHLDFEPLTLDCMEEWLWNMTMDEYSGRVQFNVSFYQQLSVVSNHVVNNEYL